MKNSRIPSVFRLPKTAPEIAAVNGRLKNSLKDEFQSIFGLGLCRFTYLCVREPISACVQKHIATNFHAAWDEGLIHETIWDLGAEVDRLENGWLLSGEAMTAGIDGGTPRSWAEETHRIGQAVWAAKADNNVLDDRYYQAALPFLDRQLGIAGLRLARFLNEAYGSDICAVKQL
jgi:hypothetical protein